MEVRSQPCSACPYRIDSPSGLWAWEEYEKLRDYDPPTADQPTAVFACHATPEHYCHGWAVVHMSRGHAYELFALRLAGSFGSWSGRIPVSDVPMFDSGCEAADHGQRGIPNPSAEARLVADRLRRKYPRLEEG